MMSLLQAQETKLVISVKLRGHVCYPIASTREDISANIIVLWESGVQCNSWIQFRKHIFCVVCCYIFAQYQNVSLYSKLLLYFIKEMCSKASNVNTK